MTSHENVNVDKPTTNTRRRGGCILLSILVVMGGVGGLLAAFLQNKDSGKNNGSLRGNNGGIITNPSTCPATVPQLSDRGVMTPDQPTEQHAPPSCITDPQDVGRYVEWQAPSDGHATLAAWTVLVDESTCDCMASTSTFAVTAHQVMRIWTSGHQEQPVQFDPSNVSTSCPAQVPALAHDGKIPATLTTVHAYTAPACASSGSSSLHDNQRQGQYFQWTAPTAGMATLAAWSILVDHHGDDSCVCATALSTFAVSAGQVLVVWSAHEHQPLQFRRTSQPSHEHHALVCPDTTRWLTDDGRVAQADWLDANGHVDEQVKTSFLMDPPPSTCNGGETPVEGLYFDWVAPADGQVTLADWTVWVDVASCDCMETVTFPVSQGQVYRVWTSLEEMQPLEFVADP